ncbi:histone H3 (Lys4) methyltransferase complex and RNA cleavage factor II complex, subunit SWD2 [Pseudoloma neurophilia]|uniref:Histone H3 (Lys4) methyltransferase complex and RNA cleavage factor II complex, subunit SWD2 n=1 Tax=Pseudoloma neurophilia TaxID=146866 RepID=A0A0R0LVV2_9MICR|nr:histone H3 (Lys4) methyltransferase complex and RNA cleavage factor II complex, subunit SWD2 [Pseudoloma neurophilia]
MDLSDEHISLLKKTQTVQSPSISSLSYIHSGISLAYTETNYLNIHCAISNINTEKINIPDIKKTVFLFDNMVLYSNKDSVKYFSYPDKQILRSFQIDKPKDIQAKLIDDTFMVLNNDSLQFYDLRCKNTFYNLNVKNCLATINNESFSILLNNTVLKIYDFNKISPRITKKFTTPISHLKLTNDNRYLIIITNKSVNLLETQTGETVHRFFIDNIRDFDISEDSQYIFFLLKQKVSIFSIKDKKLLNNIILTNDQNQLAVNPSFSQFITAGPDFTFFSVDKQALNEQ